MTFTNYQTTNNANSVLIAWISAISTTILIKDWDQNIFPSQFPFLLTLEHKDWNWNVILREIVKVISQNQNTYIVERWAWMCVQDDTASNRIQDNTPHAFESWDSVSLYRTAEQVKQIQDNMWKLTKSEAIADEYSTTKQYLVWDVVMYDWERYEAIEETTWPFDSTKREKSQIQELIFDLDKKVKTLSTNSLSEKYIVWDKYTADDNLYVQTPATESDSTVEQNIGDVDWNKEIHIQQIWNWKWSDTLKLKIKKVWDPTTTLHCEIQKWVKFEVSETESARAWNWVAIASSSIAYSDITSSRQEITLTFDEEFWRTEWELLDVVLYQDSKIVNATNYYQIACDSTKTSESNRCVCVDWETKVSNYNMPYCSSECFEDKLLSKTMNVLRSASNLSFTFPYEVKNTSNTTLNYFFDFYLWWYGSVTATVNFKKVDWEWTTTYNQNVSRTGSWGSWSTETNHTITVDPWETLTVSHVSQTTTPRYMNWTPWIFPKMNDYWLLYFAWNNVVWEIGEYWPAWFFWKKWDDFILWVESTTRTTWSIAPWNCVWFIQIWKYKIPYYWI